MVVKVRRSHGIGIVSTIVVTSNITSRLKHVKTSAALPINDALRVRNGHLLETPGLARAIMP